MTNTSCWVFSSTSSSWQAGATQAPLPCRASHPFSPTCSLVDVFSSTGPKLVQQPMSWSPTSCPHVSLHAEVTRTALFLLKVFFFSLFFFPCPFFYHFFPLCLSPSPAVCLGFASLKDGQIKSSSFFQILSPNHPSASSSRPILLADLQAA